MHGVLITMMTTPAMFLLIARRCNADNSPSICHTWLVTDELDMTHADAYATDKNYGQRLKSTLCSMRHSKQDSLKLGCAVHKSCRAVQTSCNCLGDLMKATGCSGETGLVLRVPSSS